ncbi:30S ribosomal protein S16 [Patescibacteria group bacterium]|nr:30S ribosomal protein S16 [Patescibacteria group bacterium]
MLSIRFLRQGKLHQPSYKIVVIEKTRPPKSGRFIEQLGFYNPLTKEKQLKADRINYWISKGAQPSDTMHNLLVRNKIIEGVKVAAHSIKKKKEEETEAPKTPAAKAPKQEESKQEEPKQEEPKQEEEKGEEVKIG